MPRQYIVTLPGEEPQTAKNPSKAADLIGQATGRVAKGSIVSQLASLADGDTATIAGNVQVQVVGGGEGEEEEGGSEVPRQGSETPNVPANGQDT